ncbi:hypothetical protein [Actinoallomurus sp. CA-150999]|uniref:hypothetical protein n=1 Tax=Actinoallomurus sp. CA-150999 TaxID=3239887 RepID=UPI003D929D51
MVLVDVHGSPWIIHPDPEGILGWLTAQIDLHEDGDFAILTVTYGWLGAGDLEPDRLIANLIEADWLPTNIWMTEHVSTRRRTIGGQSADTNGQRAQAPYRSPDNPTPGLNEGRKHRWNP